MITVGDFRKAIEYLGDECEVELDLESPCDRIHEVFESIFIYDVSHDTRSDKLVIKLVDDGDPDEDEDDS